jgi:hypothetical protein
VQKQKAKKRKTRSAKDIRESNRLAKERFRQKQKNENKMIRPLLAMKALYPVTSDIVFPFVSLKLKEDLEKARAQIVALQKALTVAIGKMVSIICVLFINGLS